MKICFLGTSGTFPTEKRSHPAIYLEYKGIGMLFDCGEGTQRQMRIAKIKPTKIKYIFITHWHGDHILGLPGLIFSMINMQNKNELAIYVPKGYKENLEKIFEGFEINPTFEIKIKEISEGKILDTQEFEIYSKKVKHTIDTYSFSFKQKDYIKIDENKAKELGIFDKKNILKKIKKGEIVMFNNEIISYEKVGYIKKGLKITYITDTLFFEDLINFSKESDILITESYYFFEPNLAKEHYHLDFYDVKYLFEKSNSKLLLVMHFSQRYEKEIELLKQKIESENKNIFFLEDLSYVEYYKNILKINIGKKKVEFIRDEKTGEIKLLSSQF
ncbi:MAG: ribonuclease Z [Nanopusillaceae archaeon]